MATRKTPRKMPKWSPAPDALVHWFNALLKGVAGVQVRKMFGFPAAFINGNLFAGLFQDQVFLRLGDAERASLLKEPETRVFEPMPGRPMREYVVVPPTLVNSDQAARQWLEKSRAFVAALPPKKSKTKRR
jgi:TfoX/Sxy family transcriptional regulator of competence genes